MKVLSSRPTPVRLNRPLRGAAMACGFAALTLFGACRSAHPSGAAIPEEISHPRTVVYDVRSPALLQSATDGLVGGALAQVPPGAAGATDAAQSQDQASQPTHPSGAAQNPMAQALEQALRESSLSSVEGAPPTQIIDATNLSTIDPSSIGIDLQGIQQTLNQLSQMNLSELPGAGTPVPVPAGPGQ